MSDVRRVASSLGLTVAEPTTLVLAVTPAQAPGLEIAAGIAVTTVAGPCLARELFDDQGGTTWVFEAAAGPVMITSDATVCHHDVSPRRASEAEQIVARRPSRYCPSDALVDQTRELFGRPASALAAVRGVCEYVRRSLTYAAGVSGPNTDAIQSLTAGAGVCRDFAHVVVSLCRALDVPARVAAVFAPGLTPMDFHLVAETVIDDVWYVWDATRMASRNGLVRIATGRDAADVSFCTDFGGRITLDSMMVTAMSDPPPAPDDHTSLVWMP